MNHIFTDNQHTIEKEILFEGVSLHSKKKGFLKIKPAAVSTGICFIRSDLKECPEIPAQISFLQETVRGLALGLETRNIHRVQCVLAALWGMGVDNALLEIEGDEIPILDASSFEFCSRIADVGLKTQNKSRQYLNLPEIVSWKGDHISITAVPHHCLKISFTIEYEHPFVLRQAYSYEYSLSTFIEEIAKARTFYFDHEIETLKKKNLINEEALRHIMVVTKENISSHKALFKDELVRSKILDLMGSVSLLGRRPNIHLIIHESGRRSKADFIKKIKKFVNQESGEDFNPSLEVSTGKELILPGQQLTAKQIQKIIPHRYPFLLVDSIIETDGHRKATGVKNVSMNEYFFQGHFPNHPIMPGVLILESLAQTAACLLLGMSGNHSKVAYFMSLDHVKFRKPVLPGDRLLLKVELVRVRKKMVAVVGRAYVEEELVAQGDFKFALVDEE